MLEAFGNARTCLNLNATRCTNLISLDFDQSGQIASLSLQVIKKKLINVLLIRTKNLYQTNLFLLQMLMIEKQRVARRPEGEGTFNVFYWLLGGADGFLAKQLFLDSAAQGTNLFLTPLHKVQTLL